MGHAFLPYAPPVFKKSCYIIHTSLFQYQQFQQNPELDEPDKYFLVVALDLLAGLTQGLNFEIEPLVAQSTPNLFSLLMICLKHLQAPVRQSAYALVRALAMGCFAILRPYIPAIMAEIILQLGPDSKVEIGPLITAVRALGEVALCYGRSRCMFPLYLQFF